MDEENGLLDLSDSEFMDILKGGSNLQDIFYDRGQDVISIDTNLNSVNQSDIIHGSPSDFSLSSVEGFDQNFSASDTSIADQPSPQSYTSSYSPAYGYQHSPSTASVDSGIPNSIDSPTPESPQLSPDYVNATYLDYVQDADYTDLLRNGTGYPSSGLQESQTDLQQEFLLRLINQQVQQALIQQQQQQQVQSLQTQQQPSLTLQQQQQQPSTIQQQQQQQTTTLQQQQIQQQLVRLAQQQQILQERNQLIESPIIAQDVATTQNKSDSQLRKMLMQTKSNFTQTKNTIMNSIQEKKGKMTAFKFPKSGNNKPNKRKMPTALNDEKSNKVASFSTTVPMIADDNTFQHSAASRMEGLLYQQTKYPSMQTNQHLIKMETSNKASLSSKTHDISPVPSSVHSISNASSKVPITRLKGNSLGHIPSPKVSKVGAKRTRVEHVVIEKRYRMKITDSLNELKIMLGCTDDKKATKNTVLQAAIEEIKRIKKINESLTRKNKKMRMLFEELRSIGIIPSSHAVSSSGSESNSSEDARKNLEAVDEIEPEVNQDHYASPFQRQSARDGAKLISCFTIFMFLFVNPLSFLAAKSGISNGGTYTSRHLLSIGSEQETTPQYFLATNLVNIVLSFFILMFMLLRGNPRCTKNSKLTLCYQSQLRKAQTKINKRDYEDAKGFLRIALFVIGNSCPKSFYGQVASFSWKCCCHILYQLGIVTALKSIGRTIFPSSVSLDNERQDEEYAASLSAEAYKKLHEIALKDPSSTYIETACYLMNAIYAAEISGDHELLCTAYATGVIHMKEKVLYPSFFQCYFTVCAHHVSLASKDDYPFAVDWIFENRGYEYFANGSWDVKNRSQFYVHSEDPTLDEPDLLQMVYAQFQEYLLLKALKRMAVPETYYPNEGKIELRQRALSFLNSLGTGPVSEHLDNVSIYHQSLYGWLAAAMKHLLHVFKNGYVFDKDELIRLNDMFEEVDEHHRHELIVMVKAVLSSYTSVKILKQDIEELNIVPSEVTRACHEVNKALMEASQIIEQHKLMRDDNDDINESEVAELIMLLCCELMIEARFTLWEINSSESCNEKELELMMHENELLQFYSSKYLELSSKVQQHDYEIQSMSGINQLQLCHGIKRTNHIKSVCTKKNERDCFYYDSRQYPMKQSGF